MPETGLQLRSLVTAEGELQLSLARVPVGEPGPDEVVVGIEAAPIHPSDLALLLGPADLATAVAAGSGDDLTVTAAIPENLRRMLAARVGQSLPVGNEGAGTVVRAGAAATGLLGRRVAFLAGATFGQHRTLRAREVLPLPEDVSAEAGAAAFVNPLTALAMVETMRREGHTGLVHTAAGSALGQMLVKLCVADGVPLVNVVRTDDAAATLRSFGATHVVNSSAPGFVGELVAAVRETGATLAFDAVGGGKLAGQILTAMEAAASEGAAYSRYGSSRPKQVYVYGRLDPSPTEIGAAVGMTWGVGGFLVMPFLERLGAGEVGRLRQRVLAGLGTTFATTYSRTVSLHELLDPDTLRAANRRATGEKLLLVPTR